MLLLGDVAALRFPSALLVNECYGDISPPVISLTDTTYYCEGQFRFVQALPSQGNVVVTSRWHFASVVALLLAFGVATLVSRLCSHNGALEFHAGQRLSAYLQMALLEWLLFAYLVFGIRRNAGTASSIIDACPGGLRRWISSIAWGIGAAVLWMVLGAIIMAPLRPTTHELRIIQSFLPRGVTEKLGFAALTLTAGFCEEFVYRGYLQRQFQALTGSLTGAILLQAAMFALLHVRLPWKFALSATAMAIFLGVLVSWKKTLVPAMLVHTLVNLLGGLLSSAGSA